MNKRSNGRIGVAILGSGRIGTDLMMKALQSELLDCKLVAGRNLASDGMQRARSLGVRTSDGSIGAVLDMADELDLVFDATSADEHRKHAPQLEHADLIAVDLTPAKVGYWCVPTINLASMRYAKNINLITCGGQASVPLVEVLTRVVPGIDHVHVHSLVAPDSIGPATLANIDDYYASTASALKRFANAPDAAVELELAPEGERPCMLTTIRARVAEVDLRALKAPLEERVDAIRRSVPGYALAAWPTHTDGWLEISVRVRGRGDYLPTHAGNLDIINCAALAVAEDHAVRALQPKRAGSRAGGPLSALSKGPEAALAGLRKPLEEALAAFAPARAVARRFARA